MGAYEDRIGQIIVSEDVIQAHIKTLAYRISRDYAGVDDLVMVGILKGAFIFLSDLTRHMNIPHTVDFMALSSYGQRGDQAGAVRIMMDLRESIVGRNVLIVEDIVDQGHTLRYLMDTLQSRHPASLKTCVLVRKDGKAADVPVDYLGFEIPDVWVVGYGLDYKERYRTLPYIAEYLK